MEYTGGDKNEDQTRRATLGTISYMTLDKVRAPVVSVLPSINEEKCILFLPPCWEGWEQGQQRTL